MICEMHFKIERKKYFIIVKYPIDTIPWKRFPLTMSKEQVLVFLTNDRTKTTTTFNTTLHTQSLWSWKSYRTPRMKKKKIHGNHNERETSVQLISLYRSLVHWQLNWFIDRPSGRLLGDIQNLWLTTFNSILSALFYIFF